MKYKTSKSLIEKIFNKVIIFCCILTIKSIINEK